MQGRLLLLVLLAAACGASTGPAAQQAQASSAAHRLACTRAAGTDVTGLGSSEGTFGPQQCSQHPRTPPEMGSAAEDVERTLWIVRFTSYRMIADHEASLTEVLESLTLNATAAERGSGSGGSGCSRSADGNGSGDGTGECAAQQPWQWVHRRNKAAAHPTDFGLLSFVPDAAEAVKAQLLRSPVVKDMHVDRRLTRALMWETGSTDPLQGDAAGKGEATDQGDAAAGPTPTANFHHNEDEDFVRRRPGRLQTRPTEGLHGEGMAQLNMTERRRLLGDKHSVTGAFQAERLWEKGFRGAGVKMGVFDTGIRDDHPHVKNIKERSNWTHEPTLEDGLGHGSFVAGVIASGDNDCPGFAPDVELYTFRVFTNDQVSYTSWFLDAFNYAIATGMNIVNLSIGGPDYLDIPFVEKVWEVTSNGIIMVSAIGNDGPLYGTLNNPADQSDVIGIGGIDYQDNIAGFSSRGMSTWELPFGSGRAKPDVVAYGKDVMGSRIEGGCRSLSGTSVASPVVAGAVCLLASTVPEAHRWEVLNPASMKQALVEGAVRVPEETASMFVQGQGKLDLLASQAILATYLPRASVVPAHLNLTDCPHAWPYCRQPLYAKAMPTIFNATVLNGMGLTGEFQKAPVFTPSDDGGKLLNVQFEYSEQLWPWSGFLALFIRVEEAGSQFRGRATGEITFTIVSPPALGERKKRTSQVSMGLTVDIIPTPKREMRVLWDQFHSLRYPPGYLPRDSLEVRSDILDWHGDHPATNYHDMYDALRDGGYFLEILGSPLSCFDATQYGAVLIADPEEEFYPEEVAKLAADVAEKGLGLVVFAEWFNVDVQSKMRFFDDNTRSWWTPVTGGANVPALNELLEPFGAALGDMVLEGQLPALGGDTPWYASGANIVKWPAGGWLHSAVLTDKASEGVARDTGLVGGATSNADGLLGLAQHGLGRVAVYGDSGCLDSSHQRSPCYNMLQTLLRYAAQGTQDKSLHTEATFQAAAVGADIKQLPKRPAGPGLKEFSNVLSGPLRCHSNTPPQFHNLKGGNWKPHRGRDVAEQQKGKAVDITLSADSVAVLDGSEAAAPEPAKETVDHIAGGAGELIDAAAADPHASVAPGVMSAIGANAVRPVVEGDGKQEQKAGATKSQKQQVGGLFLINPKDTADTDTRNSSAAKTAAAKITAAGGSVTEATAESGDAATAKAIETAADVMSTASNGSHAEADGTVAGGGIPDIGGGGGSVKGQDGDKRGQGASGDPMASWQWLLLLGGGVAAVLLYQVGRRRRRQRRTPNGDG
eukprot:CAMPEP_0206137894 /NCGR_PEP_ID=MMETSP1473-20131121/2920_1 /ASSEMBLY_ACC=CAM_ASM_001109 /TAXON_ID=1461547 /ORGANISM="Stichococcus sp, Strain RCC1054" /LENGTH=1275 /DNA_ID=CAMNT_0053531159 /DNA_START=224 /DNA_END=4048 /DNA_ORIENTATION=+